MIGDRYGALALGAWARSQEAPPRSACTRTRSRASAPSRPTRRGSACRSTPSCSTSLDPALVVGARLVLVQLPRSLDALDEIAALVAAHAAPTCIVLAGGRLKHMTRAMNDVLGRHFGQVSAGLARQKSRLLTAPGAATGRLGAVAAVAAARRPRPDRGRPRRRVRRVGGRHRHPAAARPRRPDARGAASSSTWAAAPGCSRRPTRDGSRARGSSRPTSRAAAVASARATIAAAGWPTRWRCGARTRVDSLPEGRGRPGAAQPAVPRRRHGPHRHRAEAVRRRGAAAPPRGRALDGLQLVARYRGALERTVGRPGRSPGRKFTVTVSTTPDPPA